MDRYPDYRFAASSAQHYAWLEQDAPELFARVAARIAEGRWEPVGGSWVEPDCNLPSGESLVRQLLYGQRYFESRFGRRCDVYWSPDTFGHNGQMPQILRHCGIERFLTQKLSWNQFTRPPHDSFTWVGIDGSEVLAHLPPIGTYNAELSPGQLHAAASPPSAITTAARSAWRCSAMATAAGARRPRCSRAASRTADLRGLPELEQSPSARFFERLEDERAALGRIRGQLYFEYHRGTYTSQARTKRGNREGERALHDAEAAATLAWARGLAPYPAEEIAQLWPTLLRNQFHDILPGTSLREVHERTEREHRELRAAAEAVRERAVAALADDRPGDGAPLNLCGFARREVIETPDGPALGREPGARLRAPGGAGGAGRADPRRRPDRVSNSLVAAELATDGRLLGLRRADGAEALAAPANLFELFDDRPTAFDAWELEPYAAETREPVPTARTSASSWPRARCAPSCAPPRGRPREHARTADPPRCRVGPARVPLPGRLARAPPAAQGLVPARGAHRHRHLRGAVRRPRAQHPPQHRRRPGPFRGPRRRLPRSLRAPCRGGGALEHLSRLRRRRARRRPQPAEESDRSGPRCRPGRAPARLRAAAARGRLARAGVAAGRDRLRPSEPWVGAPRRARGSPPSTRRT